MATAYFTDEQLLESANAKETQAISPEAILYHLNVESERSGLERIQYLTDCIQICQMSTDFMIQNSTNHEAICKTLAKISELCARECEALETSEYMQSCARQCRKCAESFQEMSTHFL